VDGPRLTWVPLGSPQLRPPAHLKDFEQAWWWRLFWASFDHGDPQGFLAVSPNLWLLAGAHTRSRWESHGDAVLAAFQSAEVNGQTVIFFPALVNLIEMQRARLNRKTGSARAKEKSPPLSLYLDFESDREEIERKKENITPCGALQFWRDFKFQLQKQLPAEEWGLWVRPLLFLKELGSGHLLLALPPVTRIMEAYKAREPWLRAQLGPLGWNCSATKYPEAPELDRLVERAPGMGWEEVRDRLLRKKVSSAPLNRAEQRLRSNIAAGDRAREILRRRGENL
jgi:hypothetical protein